ncbi:Putative signal peptide peptidase SppA [Fundidesulfovibrio magnetotacticus]|uniref:Signal peptide peptidase SppA n=1 Tax=Fundidesulfovibrio magnetotacticus TaxID=2730080 RepID=A0A6V8LRS2_9BACT|nr:S49 family peptidase [Fundidesulfovibrio magnetotacticus]GFK92486.1 Putative signal peptide peptidase SppA [Fundidesulfovibrio magnetotacticus]
MQDPVRALSRVLILSLALALCGCSPRFSLMGQAGQDPLKQYDLEGKGRGKVLALWVTGFIGAGSRQGLLGSRPGALQEAAAVLRKAREDREIKALVLFVDSPGGTVAGSDLLLGEIEAFKAATGAKVVAQALTVCASGGYYAALGADEIQALPSSLVGSVGTVFITPKLAGLMGKIGVEAEVAKSGDLKDMGSPFRPSTEEERRLAAELTEQLNRGFLALLDARRSLAPAARAEVARAGVYSGSRALELGLVDRLGHPADAVARARTLAGLPPDARLVAYRRQKVHDDTLYNTATADYGADAPRSLVPDLSSMGLPLEAGCYYLWPQALPGGGR